MVTTIIGLFTAPAGQVVSTAQRRVRTAVSLVSAFALFLAAVVALQWASGAYATEFSAWPDEPAHVVSSLMIRDYIVAGFPGHPVRYAEAYYLHYPKVAFGMWGPAFHVLGGVWMLASASRLWILMLMACTTALLATALFRALRKEFPLEARIVAGLLLVATPVMQAYTGMVMADPLCALLDFYAALCFGRYVQTERARDSVLFGCFATLSILAKPNGLVLALVPLLTLVLARRLDLLRRREFWYPAAIVLLAAGPWQWWEFQLLNNMPRPLRLGDSIVLLRMIGRMVGGAVLPFALAGLAVRIAGSFRARGMDGVWAAAASLAFAVWLFHFLLPVGGPEPRYMLALLAPLLMFFTAGVGWTVGRLPLGRIPRRAAGALVTLACATVFGAVTFTIPPKPYRGMMEVSQALLARPDLAQTVFLVSSRTDGEGLLISEIALAEKRPGHIVLRASKMLGQSDWASQRYKLLLDTPQKVMEYLASVPVRIVILDRAPSRLRVPHHELLIRTLESYADRWRFLGSYPQRRRPSTEGARVDVYELSGAVQSPAGKIRIEMPYTWGRPIHN